MRDDDKPEVTIYEGDASWHDGPGFYYVIDEYPDEGSCGAFATAELARDAAVRDGYVATGKVLHWIGPRA